ncbi:hypothetical protein BCR35DRAFT_310720 [Leucosporidium creatinivorum]|uniref:F-box domain-containing protein n=1 Tax=Leucosporidium creatinivorum TaxID=106004 RepID=A0A1Y2CW21_9BASI|nr:hypothetical protein BCR35DRAFT_310720 [Leucosporidium creatinivorum]
MSSLPACSHGAPSSPFPSSSSSPPPSSCVPRLPPELIGCIIKLASESLGNSKAFKKRCALLYCCSLVAVEWRSWAEGELYGGRIFISSSRRASKLVRTLEIRTRLARKVKQLAFGDGDSPATTTDLRTYELLKLCSRLKELSLRLVYDFQIPWLAMVFSLRCLILDGHFNNPFFPEIYFASFVLPNLVEMHLEDCHGCRAGLWALLSPRTVPALRALTIYPFKPKGGFDEGLEELLVSQVSEELLSQLQILVVHESLLGDTSSRFNPSQLAEHDTTLLVNHVVEAQSTPSIDAVAQLVTTHPSVKRARIIFAESPPDPAQTKEERGVEREAQLEWVSWLEAEGFEAARQLGVELILEKDLAEHGVDSRVPKSLWRAKARVRAM